jgi:hypothetical protein
MARPAQVTIDVSTSSQVIPETTPLQSASYPTITINGTAATPSFAPQDWPSGVQVVVINSTGDLSDPGSIISDKYNLVWSDPNGGWWDTYSLMWDNVGKQILGSGDPQQQLVIAATYGMDLGMFPVATVVELFLGLGAGPALQEWINTATPSGGGDWVGFPANYVLIGSSGLGYGQGTEQYDYTGNSPVDTSVSVTLDNNPEPPTGTN